ncbi:MAG: hypothetical protein ACE365_02270 [Gammaproteobacteria bacterium]
MTTENQDRKNDGKQIEEASSGSEYADFLEAGTLPHKGAALHLTAAQLRREIIKGDAFTGQGDKIYISENLVDKIKEDNAYFNDKALKSLQDESPNAYNTYLELILIIAITGANNRDTRYLLAKHLHDKFGSHLGFKETVDFSKPADENLNVKDVVEAILSSVDSDEEEKSDEQQKTNRHVNEVDHFFNNGTLPGNDRAIAIHASLLRRELESNTKISLSFAKRVIYAESVIQELKKNANSGPTTVELLRMTSSGLSSYIALKVAQKMRDTKSPDERKNLYLFSRNTLHCGIGFADRDEATQANIDDYLKGHTYSTPDAFIKDAPLRNALITYYAANKDRAGLESLLGTQKGSVPESLTGLHNQVKVNPRSETEAMIKLVIESTLEPEQKMDAIVAIALARSEVQYFGKGMGFFDRRKASSKAIHDKIKEIVTKKRENNTTWDQLSPKNKANALQEEFPSQTLDKNNRNRLKT